MTNLIVRNWRRFSATSLLSILLIGCQSAPPPTSNEGGFYGGDSGPDGIPKDLDLIPDAIPIAEPKSRGASKPYTIMGKTYYPLSSSKGFVQRGTASWYGKKFHGKKTANGEVYNMWAMTAAHTVLPLPTYVEVENLNNGRKVVVRVNDRGPFLHGRVIDLSYVAAHKLGIIDQGTGLVEIRAIEPKGHIYSDQSGNANVGSVSNSAANASKPPVGNFFVQVAAYSVLENAIRMRQQLSQWGYFQFSDSEKVMVEKGQPYRVRLGPFSGIEQALQVKIGIESKLGEPTQLISPKSSGY